MKGPVSKFAIAAGVAVIACAVGLVAQPEAEAQRGLRAHVYLTQARIPRRLTEKGLIRFARSHGTKKLRETTDKPLKEREWKANLVTAFTKPPGDLQFELLYFDIDEGARRFIRTETVFVNDRKEKTFVNRVRLDRESFKPNHKIELVVTVRRREVGKLKFTVVGEEVRRTGEVSFSDDETRQRD